MWLREIIFEFFYITDINSLISRSENRDNISMIVGYTLTEKSNENRKFLITIIILNFKLFTSSSSFLFFFKVSRLQQRWTWLYRKLHLPSHKFPPFQIPFVAHIFKPGTIVPFKNRKNLGKSLVNFWTGWIILNDDHVVVPGNLTGTAACKLETVRRSTRPLQSQVVFRCINFWWHTFSPACMFVAGARNISISARIGFYEGNYKG